VAQLDITNLHCVKTRDGIGKDEIDIYLTIDGGSEQFVAGPYLLDKSKNDEDVTVNIHRDFDDQVVVMLRERNGGRDTSGGDDLELNDLGTEVFNSTVQTPRNVAFHGNNGRVAYTAKIGVSA
jgi:hypothetical protein